MRILLACLLVLFGFSAFSQYTVKGKITDESGETLIGVTVVLKSNRSIGASTDIDGNYSLSIPGNNPETIIISYISFKTIEEQVSPGTGPKNFIMQSESKAVQEVEVTAKAVKAKEYYVETIKKNSAVTLDYISSETIKKTGDPNVAAAVSRVTGVSTTNNGFFTVRGIGDRYVKTSVNGSIIPTLDPFTNNIKLDMFPSSLVDNIMITKTASPELPGDWSGAYISVETKDYPEQLTVNVESSVGYNTNSTFKNVISSQRSKTDWVAYDNGMRNRNHNEFSIANMDPTIYQEFVALGMGGYYNSIGVTGTTPWNDDYYKLGLVQLGLLEPAKFNDASAFNAAKQAYEQGQYKQTAFNSINASIPSTGKSFPNNWNTINRQAPLNLSESATIGSQVRLLGMQVGFLAGGRYTHSTAYDAHSLSQRVQDVSPSGDPNDHRIVLASAYDQQVGKETSAWSALLNTAFKLNSNNSISLMFMPNRIGVNTAKNMVDDRDYTSNKHKISQIYDQRRQLVYQFNSEHYMPSTRMKASLSASYTKGNSSTPDFKDVAFIHDPVSNSYQIGPTVDDGINRYFRYLSENIFDGKASVEIPIAKPDKGVRKLKGGVAYLRNDRVYDQYRYSLWTGPYSHIGLYNGDLNAYFDHSHFDLYTYTDINGQQHQTIDMYYKTDETPDNHSFGYSDIRSAYVMTDYCLTDKIRLSGGVRAEKAVMFTDLARYDSLQYAEDDPRRVYKIGVPAAKPGKLDETTYLPSANIIYKLKDKDNALMNVRLNYSQSVARPSLRELSDIGIFDFEHRKTIFGNSDLKTVRVKNYDVRYETYFRSGDNFSISLFRKDFKNHIEFVNTNFGYTWQNVDKSYCQGIELEGKKLLSQHFDVRANVAFIQSETRVIRKDLGIDAAGEKIWTPIDTLTRTMYDQAPYLINTILTYSTDSSRFNVSLSYNVQGRRLSIVEANPFYPMVYELPRHMLDLKVVKAFGKHMSTSLTVHDILGTSATREYDGYSYVYDKYTYGTDYSFAITYKL